MNKNYYEEIKRELINNETRNIVKDYSKNKSDLTTYYKVGKLLSDAGKCYGEGILKQYSIKLVNELNKKYNSSFLYKLIYFYNICKLFPALPENITWSHFYEMLSIKDVNKIKYYIKITTDNNLSTRELRSRIKSQEYECYRKLQKINLLKMKN